MRFERYCVCLKKSSATKNLKGELKEGRGGGEGGGGAMVKMELEAWREKVGKNVSV